MKLKEYIQYLQEFVSRNPEALDLPVFTSSDDEGNNFSLVKYRPSLGYYEKSGGFTPIEEFSSWDLLEEDANAVCLN